MASAPSHPRQGGRASATSTQDHHPRLLIGQIRRTERSGNEQRQWWLCRLEAKRTMLLVDQVAT